MLQEIRYLNTIFQNMASAVHVDEVNTSASAASSNLDDPDATPSNEVAIIYDDRDDEAVNISTRLMDCIGEIGLLQSILLSTTLLDLDVKKFEEKLATYRGVIVILSNDILHTQMYRILSPSFKKIPKLNLIPIVHNIEATEVPKELQRNEDNLLHYSDDHIVGKVGRIIQSRCLPVLCRSNVARIWQVLVFGNTFSQVIKFSVDEIFTNGL